MLPLTPANNWTATIIFCGGTNLQPDQSVELLSSVHVYLTHADFFYTKVDNGRYR
jgi:hypothetical protein